MCPRRNKFFVPLRERFFDSPPSLANVSLAYRGGRGIFESKILSPGGRRILPGGLFSSQRQRKRCAKRSHLVALRSTKISASHPSSICWPGERWMLLGTAQDQTMAAFIVGSLTLDRLWRRRFNLCRLLQRLSDAPCPAVRSTRDIYDRRSSSSASGTEVAMVPG